MRYPALFVACVFCWAAATAQPGPSTEANTLRTTSDSIAAADSIPWRYSGAISINLANTSFVNWAQGGDNSIAVQSLGLFSLKYRRRNVYWDNVLDVRYGITRVGPLEQQSIPWRKNEDQIDFISKFGYKFAPKWAAVAFLNFRSQFAPGLQGDTLTTSLFLNPGYLTLALGADYKPNSWLSAMLSPIASRFTFVTDERLNSAGAYGVDTGQAVRTQIGALVSILVSKNWEKMKINSRLDLFTDYGDNPGAEIDVFWNTVFSYSATKWLSFSVTNTVLYDQDSPSPIIEDVNGVRTVTGQGPRVQIRNLLLVGVAYKFGN
jgi:Protein of unknown function (DUF3078)